jgi:hypothetical protein
MLSLCLSLHKNDVRFCDSNFLVEETFQNSPKPREFRGPNAGARTPPPHLNLPAADLHIEDLFNT